MIRRPVILLAFWISTVLLMAAGMLAPNTAAAHPGHDDSAAAAWVIAPSRSGASLGPVVTLELRLGDVGRWARDATVASDDDPAAAACAVAACCGTGHACCAADVPGASAAPGPQAGEKLRVGVAGLSPGQGATALPEPPRPTS